MTLIFMVLAAVVLVILCVDEEKKAVAAPSVDNLCLILTDKVNI